MDNHLDTWRSKPFWEKASHIFFIGWIALTLVPAGFRKESVEWFFIPSYIFCMVGTLISTMINMVWVEASKKVKMRDKIKELEEELQEYRRGP